MIEFGDTIFYIDLNAFDKAITISNGKSNNVLETEEKVTSDGFGQMTLREQYNRTIPKGKEIDATKYDLLKTLLEYIIDYDEISDDTLGADRALSLTPFPFKLAFNTLYNEGIIKEKK